MARPKKTPNPAAVDAITQKTPDDDLPLVESLTLLQTTKGWTVVKIVSQGHAVLDKELMCEPTTKSYAHEQLKIAIVRTFILPKTALDLLA